MNKTPDDDDLERPRPRLSDEQIAHAEERVARGLPAFVWQQYVRRRRHVRFVEHFLYEWLRTRSIPDAAMRAARIVFNNGRLTDVGAKKKGWAMLKRPDVSQAVEKVFEQHGFSFADMVQLHIAHIRGSVVRKAVKVKDGKDKERIEYVDEVVPPNLTALLEMERLIIPRLPQKFQFENTTKNRHVGGVLGGSDVPPVETDDYPRLSAKVEPSEPVDDAIVIDEPPEEHA